MSYSAGRMPIYVDLTTAKADYTNETFNSMSLPITNQLCDLFGMHIISDLTIETARGNRYFIGYDDEDPKFAIGWAIGNTNANIFYLLCVGMFYGEPLSPIFDTISSSTISDGSYYFRLIERNFSNTTNKYFFFNYISDEHFKGISPFYALPSVSGSSTVGIWACMFKVGASKLIAWWYSNQYATFDYTKDGLLTYICKTNTYFITAKNYIGNSDVDYIVPFRLEHGVQVEGLYLYSKVLTTKKIYSINGEYYYCVLAPSDASFLVKVNYIP